MVRTIFYSLVFLLAPVLLLVGCEGPQGPRGVGADDIDLEPPSITLIRPTANETVVGDTFTVEARATDNHSIRRVEFYVDGTMNLGGDSIAVDSFGSSSYRYSVKFSLPGAGLSHGNHYLVARAVDFGLNYTDTPVIPFASEVFQYQQELKQDYDNGLADGIMFLPDSYGDKYYNVRFDPVLPCQLLEVKMAFMDPTTVSATENGGCDIDLFVWNTTSPFTGKYVPGDSVLQKTISFGDIILEGWSTFDLRDEAVHLDSTFHVGWSPPDDQYQAIRAAGRGMVIMTSADSVSTTNPYLNRSGEWEPERGWGTMAEHYGQWRVLRIRAVVLYDGGSTATLEPAPILLHEGIVSEAKTNE